MNDSTIHTCRSARCPDAFLLAPSPFPICSFPFLPTTATPSHRPHPYSFRDPPRSPTTLSRQSYPVFSFAQFSNSSIIYLCFSITSRLIDLFATDSRRLVHISTTFRSRSPPILDVIPPFFLLSVSFVLRVRCSVYIYL